MIPARSTRFASTLLLSTSALLAQTSQPDSQPARKIDLRVLYAGSEEGPRTADFVRFLRSQFTVVGATPYPTFTPSEADDFDVVILDVEMHPKENSIGIGPQPTLPKDYSRATVLVNGPGVIVAEKIQAKLDWL